MLRLRVGKKKALKIPRNYPPVYEKLVPAVLGFILMLIFAVLVIIILVIGKVIR